MFVAQMWIQIIIITVANASSSGGAVFPGGTSPRCNLHMLFVITPFSFKLQHAAFHGICTKSVFIVSKILTARYVTSCINNRVGGAGFFLPGKTGGVLQNISVEDPDGCFTVEAGKEGECVSEKMREFNSYLLSLQWDEEYIPIQTDLYPHSCIYLHFLLWARSFNVSVVYELCINVIRAFPLSRHSLHWALCMK